MIASRRRPRSAALLSNTATGNHHSNRNKPSEPWGRRREDSATESEQPFSLQALHLSDPEVTPEPLFVSQPKQINEPTWSCRQTRRVRRITYGLLLGTMLWNVVAFTWSLQKASQEKGLAPSHIASEATVATTRTLSTRRSDPRVKVRTRRVDGTAASFPLPTPRPTEDIAAGKSLNALQPKGKIQQPVPVNPVAQMRQSGLVSGALERPSFDRNMPMQQFDPRWAAQNPQGQGIMNPVRWNNANMQWPGVVSGRGGAFGYPQQAPGPTLGAIGNGRMEPPDYSGPMQCDLYGGPALNSKAVEEVTYWRTDLESDASFVSQYYNENNQKYLTFELESSIGWDRQRTMFESAVVLAHAMGRTLVLPPRSYSDSNETFLGDVFQDIQLLSQRYRGIQIIMMEEFFNTPGLLRRLKQEHPAVVPPFFRNPWDVADNVEIVWQYLRRVSFVPSNWDPRSCIIAFPQGNSTETLEELMTTIWDMRDGRPRPQYLDFQGRPVPVNAPTIERLRELAAGRKAFCTYDQATQQERIIHFTLENPGQRSTLATPFYSSIFFEDWKQDLWYKRVIRDHIRYNDMIMCAAARVVESLQGIHNYDAIHIRQSSFEADHSDVTSDMSWIVAETKGFLRKESVLFLATDEVDTNLLQPLRDAFNVVTLSNYSVSLPNFPPALQGMVEQVILAGAETFGGTFYSSFSGYTNRLRGYYSTKRHFDPNNEGSLKSYYHSPADKKQEMRIYRAIRPPFTIREFPISWRDIDKGFDLIDSPPTLS